MDALQSQKKYCPYCSAKLELTILIEDLNNVYIEDCHVCCQPISVHVYSEDGNTLELRLSGEDEPFP